MHYFYILRSLKNGKLYLGQTPNLRDRIKSHNSKKNYSTKSNIPYELIYYSAFKNKQDAINCERYFKTTAGWRRIKNMLESTLQESIDNKRSS